MNRLLAAFNMMKYSLSCGTSMGVVRVNGEPLIAHGDACRNRFDSDLCNRDELCFGNTKFKFCCSKNSLESQFPDQFDVRFFKKKIHFMYN